MARTVLMVDFLSDFVHDEALRCQVLRNESERPKGYDFDDQQWMVLRSWDLQLIVNQVKTELIELGIDLLAKKREIMKTPAAPDVRVEKKPASPEMASFLDSEAMYPGGGLHIRKVQPATIKAATETEVTIIGNGFDQQTAFGFSNGGVTESPIVVAEVVKSSCDLDLYQRATVKVTLAAGTWTIQARRGGDEKWTTDDLGTLVVGA